MADGFQEVDERLLEAAVSRSDRDADKIQSLESELTALRRENTELAAKLAEAEKFKAYTHQRMDEAGVPHEVPESPHTAAGCRIGGRFDWLLNELQRITRNCQCNLDGKREQEALKKAALAKLAAAESREAALRRMVVDAECHRANKFTADYRAALEEQLNARLLSRPTAEPTKEPGDGSK